MRTIGLRAEPNCFIWAVMEGTLESPVLVESGKIQIPATFAFPQGANHLRAVLTQLIAQHHVSKAGVRTPETVPRSTESLRQRLRIEGVLLAAVAEAGIEVEHGPLATISRLLGIKSAKTLLEDPTYRGIDLGLCKRKSERQF